MAVCLETLIFGEANDITGSLHSPSFCCPLCDQQFSHEVDINVSSSESTVNPKQSVLHHMAVSHKFIIADIELVADLPSYLTYWKERLLHTSLADICSAILTNSAPKDIDPQEKYYLLSDILPEDKDLRDRLQRQKLDEVLATQQRERLDATFHRPCLFCKDFSGDRTELFGHMTSLHHFNIGSPDNIVYINEYLDVLSSKLDRCLCLFCEKTFKDRYTLYQHMRKKDHRRINPDDKSYDRFYVINYLELGKNWQKLQKEHDDVRDADEEQAQDSDWQDWQEPGSAMQCLCLFCDASSDDFSLLKGHLARLHGFDWDEFCTEFSLGFYSRVKVVNYIRRQMHELQCPFCELAHADRASLQRHLSCAAHGCKLPARSVWDQPQYYFPTYEDDGLLCSLGAAAEDSDADDSVCIVAEERPTIDYAELTRRRQELLKENS